MKKIKIDKREASDRSEIMYLANWLSDEEAFYNQGIFAISRAVWDGKNYILMSSHIKPEEIFGLNKNREYLNSFFRGEPWGTAKDENLADEKALRRLESLVRGREARRKGVEIVYSFKSKEFE